MFLGDGVLWLIGEFRGVFETDMNWSMVRGNRWVICIPDYGVYGRGGQWGQGKRRWGVGGAVARLDQRVGLGIVTEALNFERRSLPK